MKWTYIIQQKTTTALLFAAILGLVLWNNLEQSKQFEKTVNSFTSLYEDRLLAESYIFQISELHHQKQQVIEKNAHSSDFNTENNKLLKELTIDISHLMSQYEATKFTMNETKQYNKLKQSLEHLSQIESAYIHSKPLTEERLKLSRTITNIIEKNLTYLTVMSSIQLTEGKEMHMETKAALKSNLASSQLETTFLIVIAIIIQILIFASKSTHSAIQQYPNLN